MGFFDKVNKAVFGGSDSKNTASSGMSLLPGEVTGAFKDYGSQFSKLLPGAAEAFTPIGTTADETGAYSAIRGGFAPTEASIGSDVAMQMNPFDTNVIDSINRQAGGEYSVLKGVMDEAGAFGSNREMLGANDIDLTRLNQIGRFKQDQYNTALQNAMTTLPGARANDVQNLMAIADRERGLQSQISQAPYTAMQAMSQPLSVLPQSGGSTSYGMSNDRKGMAAGVAGIAKAFAPMPV